MHSFVEENMAKVSKIIIFFLCVFSISALPVIVDAAALSVSPSSGSFEVGNRVAVKVIATSNVPFNAVSGILTIPSSNFALESVSKSG